MNYKLTFLGTAGNSGPYEKQISAGGIVIKLDDKQFILDPGPGALTSSKDSLINLKETEVIIATHSHVSHCTDVNAMIKGMTSNGTEKKGVLITSKSLENQNLLRDYVNEAIILSPSQTKVIDKISIQALKTKHEDETCIGVKLISPELTIAYTSDTACRNDIIEEYKDADILILNNVYPKNFQKTSSNLSTEDTIRILSKVKPALAIITHFSNVMLDANPIYEARIIQKETDVQTIAAKDHLSLTPL